MAGSGIKVDGLRQVLRDLSQLGVELDDFKESFSKIATRGADLASSLVHSKSGRLAGSIRGNRAKNKSVVIAGRASIPYAGAQNYGWEVRNIEPQLFLQRAEERLEPQLVPWLEDELNDKIKRRGLG